MNLFFYFISEEIDLKGFGQLALGIVMFIYSWNRLGVPVTPEKILLLISLLFSSSLIMIAIMTAASATAFWIINSGMVMIFLFKFREYAAYPTTIFNAAFQVVFSLLIPIGFIAFYPSLIFLRPENVSVLSYLTPLVGIVFLFLAYQFWMRGARQYSGTGS
jgi:ABC-2 type transport system permease protein